MTVSFKCPSSSWGYIISETCHICNRARSKRGRCWLWDRNNGWVREVGDTWRVWVKEIGYLEALHLKRRIVN